MLTRDLLRELHQMVYCEAWACAAMFLTTAAIIVQALGSPLHTE